MTWTANNMAPLAGSWEPCSPWHLASEGEWVISSSCGQATAKLSHPGKKTAVEIKWEPFWPATLIGLVFISETKIFTYECSWLCFLGYRVLNTALFQLKVKYLDLTLKVQMGWPPEHIPNSGPSLGTLSMLKCSQQMVLSDVLLRRLTFCKFTAFTSSSSVSLHPPPHGILLPLSYSAVAQVKQVIIWNHEYDREQSLQQLKRQVGKTYGKVEVFKKSLSAGFSGGPVVKSSPANAGDMGSIPGSEKSHMPQDN